MITVELTVRVTVDVDTEVAAARWIKDVIQKNLSEPEECVEIVRAESSPQ